jgi:hypothetical protein
LRCSTSTCTRKNGFAIAEKFAMLKTPFVFTGDGSDAVPRAFAGASAAKNPALKRNEIKSNRHRALGYCSSMIFSENRFALFRILL